MSNQNQKLQEQHHGQQSIDPQSQSQAPSTYEMQAHRSKMGKNEQEGTRFYETQLQQTKVSKDQEQGTQFLETQSYRAKLQGPDNQQQLQQPQQQQLQQLQQPQQVQQPQHPIKSEHQQPQFTSTQHKQQPIIEMPHEEQHTSKTHEAIKLPEKKPIELPQKPQEVHSHSKLHSQQPQLHSQQFHQSESSHKQPNISQPHQPQQHQQQPQQPQQQPQQPQQQPQTTIVYELYRAHVNQAPDAQLQLGQTQGQSTAQVPGVQLLQGLNPEIIQSGIANMSMSSNTWTQPLPDAQGTVIGKPNYSREDVRQDAMSLLRAVKGAGTDKDTIAEITGNRTLAQRQMIVKEYALLDGTQKRDLVQDLKDEAGGDLETLLLPLYMIPGEFDARSLEKAMYGIKNDVEVLIEVLCTRTNKEIEDMKNAWKEKIDPKVRLEEKVGDETKSLIGTTNFHGLCLKLLEAKRPPCSTPDPTQVRKEAEDIYHLLIERKDVSTSKSTLIELFTERSWAHIGALVGEFQKISDKWTMESAISHTFGNSSNTTKALQVIAEFCAQPYDFWAKRLRDAMRGLGTSDHKLVRIVVSRCEVDMNNIVLVFGQRYGDGKNLRSWIESDTSGAYSKLLLNLCGFH